MLFLLGLLLLTPALLAIGIVILSHNLTLLIFLALVVAFTAIGTALLLVVGSVVANVIIIGTSHEQPAASLVALLKAVSTSFS